MITDTSRIYLSSFVDQERDKSCKLYILCMLLIDLRFHDRL
jgi:hypothetical protein